jgi:hypothetical protein
VNSFWVEQVMVRKRNKEELFLEGKERAIWFDGPDRNWLLVWSRWITEASDFKSVCFRGLNVSNF